MKIKRLLQYSLTKAALAVAAAVVTLLAAASAHASTSWVAGGNWADDGDNFQTGIIYPTGITAGMTTTQAAAVADTIASDEASVGINFVRIGINPATISGNWSVVQAYVNELISDGMNVDLAFWTSASSVGTLTNETTWQSMWQTVDGVYKNNNSVYYEPINEPHGYSTESALATAVYVPFLGFIGKAQSHIILDGTGYAANVTAVGADSRFTGCLLGLHIYQGWGGCVTEADYESYLPTVIGSYASRTVMTEMGASATTGLNYDVSSSNAYVSYIRGVCIEVRSLGVGFAYWPSHRAGDTFRLFNSIGGGVTNPSLVDQLQYGWDFFTSAVAWGVCDFNTIGTTAYSVYRPSNGKWYIDGGVQQVWGTNADIAVPADYAGIGTAQFATWRPSNGNWYVDGGAQTQYGTSGDIPVPGDYLGTGQAQLAVFRPSNGTWYINGGSTVQWGQSGDVPVPGYYNNDGHLDMAVFRPSNSKWYVYGGQQTVWGTNGDIPVPGDYNGSGTTQLATFRPSNDRWYVYGGQQTSFGTNGDIPVPGDYTGSGFTQLATWTPSTYVWNVNGVGTTSWGTTNDIPLPLPYAIRQYMGYTH